MKFEKLVVYKVTVMKDDRHLIGGSCREIEYFYDSDGNLLFMKDPYIGSDKI